MKRKDLEQSWARTTRSLSDAAALVPQNDSASLVQFKGYIDHNELELAMDELICLGEEKGYPPEFFIPLKQAAQNMGLTERAKEIEALISKK